MKKLYLFLFLVITAITANAAEKTWVGATGGNWSTVGNWTTGGVPAASAPSSGDDVFFNNSGNIIVNIDLATIDINTLTLTGAGQLTFASPISTVYTINLGIGGSGSGVALAHNTAGKVLTLTAGGTANGTGGGGIIMTIPIGYTASIGGTLSLTSFFTCNGSGTGCNTNATTGRPNLTGQLIGRDAGSIVFNSGSVCTVNYSENVSPFYNGTNNTAEIVVFKSGSTINHYIHYPTTNTFFGQAAPNSTVKIESGNTFNFLGTLNASQTIDVTGRTYRDVNFNFFPGTNVVMTLQNNATSITDITRMGNITVNSGSVLLQTATTATVIDTTFAVADISLGQTTGGRTNVLRFAGNTGSKFNNVFISGNVLIGHPTLANTNTLTFGPSTSASATTTNITFTGTNKSLSFDVAGTNTFVTQAVPVSNTANVNYTVASGASFTFNRPLTLSTGAAPFTQTSMTVKPTGTLVVGSSGSIAAGGRLTLESTSAGTGSIGNSAGSITGNVIVQRYIAGGNSNTQDAGVTPGRRGFRFLSHPFTTDLALTPLRGTGNIDITGGGSAANATTFGFDPNNASGATNAASAFWYNPTASGAGNANTVGSGATNDNGWTAFTRGDGTTDVSNSNLWKAGSGIRVLFRGAKGEGLASTANYTMSNVTISLSGTINAGAKSFTLPAGANNLWSLVGNPYASAIDVRDLLYTQRLGGLLIGATAYVFNPNKANTTRGGYDAVDISTAGNYILPAYGVVLVQNKQATTTTINFAESNKSSNATNLGFRTTTPIGTSIGLDLVDATSGDILDEYSLRFDNTALASTFGDTKDGGKILNQYAIYSISETDDNLLAVDSRPAPTATETKVRLGMYSSIAKDFSFKAAVLNVPVGTMAFLKDKFLNIEQPITSTSFTYNFSVTADPLSMGDARFELVFRNNNALSTTFLSVAASQKNAGIEVSWNTANEINMDGYTVEESNDGSTFTKATVVAAKNATTNAYTWFDASVTNGDNYYRIKSTEKNGLTKYSNVVKVKLGGKGTEFTVYPNPVKGGIVNLQMSNVEKGNYTIRIFNNIGQEVASQTIIHNGGSTTQTIGLGANTAAGNYRMQISNGATTVLTKSIIVE